MKGFTFPYETTTERISLPGLELEITRLKSLDETIDAYFREYERTGNTELFESLCPYFGVPWPAGQALARHALTRAPDWKDLSVIEVGCGLALPSLALARAGVTRILAMDIHPDVPVFLDDNTARNQAPVSFSHGDWKTGKYSGDVLIGSDLIYDRGQLAPLADFLAVSKFREVVIVDPGRPYWESFVSLVKSQNKWNAREDFKDGAFFLLLTARM